MQAVWASGVPLDQALNAVAGAPVCFVPQAQLPPAQAYESFVHATGCCPTRSVAHDFFNGLCWQLFPHTKRRLNQLQAEQIAAGGPRAGRGALRDALTLFDENAALLDAPDPLWEALQAKDWSRLFLELRPLWREARLVLFGHALLEKLLHPRKPITAHVYRTHCASSAPAALDRWVAADLQPESLVLKPFAHLPVLGVPGWWPENADPRFYADATVFRCPSVRNEQTPCLVGTPQ